MEKIGRPRPDSCYCEMRTWLIFDEVYSIETLLQITCQLISELKLPRYCSTKFVSIWPAPEVVDGIFEVCPSATKFCPLVNKPVALGFSLWWQIFDINKQFCPLVRLGPKRGKTGANGGKSFNCCPVTESSTNKHLGLGTNRCQIYTAAKRGNTRISPMTRRKLGRVSFRKGFWDS